MAKLATRTLAITMMALFGFITVQLTPAGSAQAAPGPVVKSGDMFNDVLGGAPDGACTGIVGRDRNTDKKYVVEPGHCGEKGRSVNHEGWTSVGRLIHTVNTVTGAGQINRLDIGLIELNRNVRVAPSGLRVASPEVGEPILKHGYGILSYGYAKGNVTHVYGTDFRINIQCSPFDSGGTVVNSRGELVGIISRGFSSYVGEDTVAMRFDAIVTYLRQNLGIDFQVL
ncbi:MAG: trypsin-like serine protease [Candidatus Saccharimonadales bacterium]